MLNLDNEDEKNEDENGGRSAFGEWRVGVTLPLLQEPGNTRRHLCRSANHRLRTNSS